MSAGTPTGRRFIHDDVVVALVDVVPKHDEWTEWTEHRLENGDLVYVASGDGIVLDAEEFGPIP